MLIKTVLGFICLLTFFGSYAQNPKYNGGKPGSGVYLSLTQLVFPEVAFTYEHIKLGKVSYSASLGYKIPTGSGTVLEPFGHGLLAVYENQYLYNEFSNAIYASIAPAYYFDDNRILSIQLELFYRYFWIDQKQLSYDNDGRYQYNSLRSEQVHTPGIKALQNFTLKVAPIKHYYLNLRLFAGIGLTYQTYLYINENNKTTDANGTTTIVPYQEERGDRLKVSFHVGIKLGISQIIFIK